MTHVSLHRAAIAGLTLAPTLLLSACSCRPDYTFPDAETPFVSADPGDVGSWLSMDTTPDGARLTMAYYDRVSEGLVYAIGSPLDDGSWSWTYEKVDGWPASNGLDSGDRGKYASQATAPDGTVWVAYQDATNETLLVAHRTGGPVWELLSPMVVGGAWISLALDGDGNPVIAHQVVEDGVLRVTRWDGANWISEDVLIGQPFDETTPEGVTVHRDAGAGAYARLAIVGGVEYIASYDSAQQRLVLLEGGRGAWTQTVVDGAGATAPGAVADAGAWPSLWVDGDTLHLAYQALGTQTLRFATRTAGAWSLETVDATPWRGSDTEVFSRGGLPAVVYFDGYENNQILAERQTNGSWLIQKLAGDDAAVGYHNEVVTVSGQTWVGSYDFTHRGLALSALE